MRIVQKAVVAGLCVAIAAAASTGIYAALSLKSESAATAAKPAAILKAGVTQQPTSKRIRVAGATPTPAVTEQPKADEQTAIRQTEATPTPVVSNPPKADEQPATLPQTPAEVLAALTGRTVDDVIAERRTKPYGIIANEAGVLDAFHAEMLKLKQETLNDWVKAGTITQQEADEIIAFIQQRQAVCDGTGLGQGVGNGAGQGIGNGRGNGGNGAGRGNGNRNGGGRGMGNGLRDGSCLIS